MRTTLELPDELLRKAKIAAVQRGTTLKELMTHALEREVEMPVETTKPRQRMHFPIFTSKSTEKIDVDSKTLGRLEDEEDLRRHGLSS